MHYYLYFNSLRTRMLKLQNQPKQMYAVQKVFCILQEIFRVPITVLDGATVGIILCHGFVHTYNRKRIANFYFKRIRISRPQFYWLITNCTWNHLTFFWNKNFFFIQSKHPHTWTFNVCCWCNPQNIPTEWARHCVRAVPITPCTVPSQRLASSWWLDETIKIYGIGVVTINSYYTLKCVVLKEDICSTMFSPTIILEYKTTLVCTWSVCISK